MFLVKHGRKHFQCDIINGKLKLQNCCNFKAENGNFFIEMFEFISILLKVNHDIVLHKNIYSDIYIYTDSDQNKSKKIPIRSWGYQSLCEEIYIKLQSC